MRGAYRCCEVAYAPAMFRKASGVVALLLVGCGGADGVTDGGTTPTPTTTGTSPVTPPSDGGPASDASVTPGSDSGLPDGAAPDVPRTEVAFVGGGDGQIRTYAVNGTTGALTPLKVLAAGGDPSYFAFDETRHLVFAVDSSSNRVKSFTIDPKTGTLTAKNDVATGGNGATHVSLVAGGKYLLVAHYTSGHLSVVPVAADGTLAATTDLVVAGAMAHYAELDPAKKTVFVPCLGANVVARYRFDDTTGKLTALTNVPLPAGAGPRHLVFAPSTPFMFVVNELASTVTSFGYAAATGNLTTVETKSALPAGFGDPNTGAAIQAHPAGKWVYSSNRGADTIARFSYDAAGRLTLEGSVPTFGRVPRMFSLAGRGTLAYVANQGSGTIYGYTVSATTGQLTPIGNTALASNIGTPKFVGTARFVDR